MTAALLLVLVLAPAAVAEPPDLVTQAMAFRAQGDLGAALRVLGEEFDRDDTSVALDNRRRQVLEGLLGEFYNIDEQLYEALIVEFEGRRLAALARLRRAGMLVWTAERLEKACPLFEEVERLHPGTEEAHRAMIGRATRCSDTFDGEEEPERLLEAAAEEERGTIWGAYALYQLGRFRIWQQDRHGAKDAFRDLQENYSRELEVPRGVSLVRRAEEELGRPDHVVTPLLDRIAWRIRQRLGYEQRFLSTPAPPRLAIPIEAILVYCARILPLFVILTIVGLFRVYAGGDLPPIPRWTLPSIGALLALYWSIPALMIIWDILAPPTNTVLAWLVSAGWLFLGPVLLLALTLRGESAMQLFHLGSMAWPWRWATLATALGLLSYSSYTSQVLPTLLVFVALLAEETLYRGVLLSRFQRRMPFALAAAFSAAIFAVLRVAPAPEMAILFGLGIVLCYLRRRSGNLTIPLVVHFAVTVFTELGIGML